MDEVRNHLNTFTHALVVFVRIKCFLKYLLTKYKKMLHITFFSEQITSALESLKSFSLSIENVYLAS